VHLADARNAGDGGRAGLAAALAETEEVKADAVL
jgi:hypothetical protein